MFRHEGISQYGQPFKLSIFMLFNNMNRVIKAESEGFPEVEKSAIREMIDEIKNITELDADTAEYYCENGKISMKFINSSTHGEEYSGSVLKDSIILTRTEHYWDHILESQNSKVSLRDMKFELLKTE